MNLNVCYFKIFTNLGNFMEFLTLVFDFFVDKIYFRLKRRKMGRYILFFMIILALVVFSYIYNNYSENKVEVSQNPMQIIAIAMVDSTENNIKFDTDFNIVEKNLVEKNISETNTTKQNQIHQNLALSEAKKILKEQYDLLKAEFEKSKNPNLKDSFSFPLVMYAMLFGDTDMLKVLFDMNVDIKSDDIDTGLLFLALSGNSLFGESFDEKNENALKLLLSFGVSVSSDSFKKVPLMREYSPLSLALRFENKQAIKILLDNGADVNGRDFEGKTVIMEALKSKNENLVKFLLENNAGLDYEDFNGKSVYQYAYESGDLDVIKSIDPEFKNLHNISSDNTDNLMLLSKRADSKTLDFFIKKDLDINAVNANGENSLSLAIMGANLDGAKFLVEQGANIHQINKKEQDLFFLAVRGEYLETKYSKRPKATKQMLEYIFGLKNFDINRQDNIGSTPLIAAAASGNLEAVEFLLEKGADTSIKNTRGYDAKEAAMYYKYNDIANLIEKFEAR